MLYVLLNWKNETKSLFVVLFITLLLDVQFPVGVEVCFSTI